MKKIILNKTYFLVTFMAFILTSCLKDKGFEDGKYATVNSNTQGQKFISIPLGSRATNAIGVESKTGLQPIELFPVSFDFRDPAASDITATVEVNNNLVTTADPTAVPLPANAYNIPSMSLIVKSGQRISDPLVMNINTSLLDPSKKYGIGFSLTNVSDAGTAIPGNLKNVVFIFTIKNKYDGIYTFKGKYAHPSDRDAAWTRTQFTYPYETYLITTGPNSVSFYNTAFAAGTLPLMTPGVSGFGATALDIVFDANDKVVSVNNPAPDARNRQFQLTPGGESRFDATTKTLYLKMSMSQVGFEPIPMEIIMEYERARP